MKPNSHRNELHNNYIKGIFKINIDNDDSKFENTNNSLLINNKDFLLNKKIIKENKNKNSLKTNITQEKESENEEIIKNTNKWIKNNLKIIKNMNEKKIIYCLESEEKKNIIFAYKDNGYYIIYKYLNSSNIYDKEIKARLKWNLLSNKFKVFDNKNKLIEEINYNLNFKGWNGPTKLQIIINDNNNKYKMENKSPEYNTIYKTYVLNFIERKVMPNEKNIQIIYNNNNIDNKNNILLQFAQINNNEFILDYKFPFNNITAFALALSDLSSRTFCQ
jgi:hypothetical protein